MTESGKIYVFDEFRLEPEKRVLRCGKESTGLAKLPFRVLLYLIEKRDRVVTRRELLENFWDGSDGYDDALTRCVGTIRKALNENPERVRFVETRWREGYRFIGSVSQEANYSTADSSSESQISGLRFQIEGDSQKTNGGKSFAGPTSTNGYQPQPTKG